MKRLRCILIIIILFLQIIPAAIAAKQEAILLKCQIFRVMTNISGDTTLQEDIWADEDSPKVELKKAMSFLTAAKLTLGDNNFEVNDKGWFWNGKVIDFGPSEESSLPEDQIKIISSTNMMTNSGEMATIEISSKQKIQYFEKQEDGLFKLKEFEEPTQLRIESKAEKIDEKMIRISDLKFSLRLIKDREPIEGVNLPVGRPIIQSRDYTMNFKVVPGKDYGIIFHPGDGQGVLIIRLQANYVTESSSKENK